MTNLHGTLRFETAAEYDEPKCYQHLTIQMISHDLEDDGIALRRFWEATIRERPDVPTGMDPQYAGAISDLLGYCEKLGLSSKQEDYDLVEIIG